MTKSVNSRQESGNSSVIASAAKQSMDRHDDKSSRDDKSVVRAYLKELRMTPRKVSLVASLVRGRSVDDALVILSHTPKRAAKPLAKLIASARANATNNHGLKADGLQITTLSVTSGPRLKRFRPVARGQAHPFQKRTANILVEISGEIKQKKAAGKETGNSSQEAAKAQTSDSRLRSSDKKGAK